MYEEAVRVQRGCLHGVVCLLVPEVLDDALHLVLVRVHQIQQHFTEGVPHGLVVALVEVDPLELALHMSRDRAHTRTQCKGTRVNYIR